MTINNIDMYLENIWDWGFLNASLGGQHRAMSDIDGIAERHGHFLIIETKSENVDIPQGQQILLSALNRNKNFVVLVVHGSRNKPTKIEYYPDHEILYPSEETLQQIVAAWYNLADRGDNPHDKFKHFFAPKMKLRDLLAISK